MRTALSIFAALVAGAIALAFTLPYALGLLLCGLAAALAPLLLPRPHPASAALDADTLDLMQKLIDVMPEPVYIKDAQSRYLLVNDSFAQAHRYTKTQIVGRTPESLFGDNEYGHMVRAEDLEILAGKSVLKQEHGHNPVTGEERYQLVSKQAITRPDGNKLIVGVNMNTTTWRIAEREVQTALARETELRKRTQNFVQRLIDVIPDPVYVKNQDSRYVMVNDAFAKERHRSKAELVGISSYDLAPNKEVGALAASEDAAVLAGGEVQKEQHTTMPVTGEECFRIVSKRRCEDADGNPVVVGAHFYITHWKVAERNLQAALEREVERRERTQAYVQRLIDVIPQPVFVRDADSRYVMVNDAFVRERSTQTQDVVGYTPLEMAVDRNLAQFAMDEDKEVLQGRVIFKEEQGVHPMTHRENFRIISKRACLDAEGRPVIVGANFDITSWRVAERELQAALADQSRTREFLQSVIEILPNPLFVEDDQQRYVMANRAFASMFGRTVDSILGKTAEQLSSPELANRLGEERQRMLERPHGAIHEAEIGIADPEGAVKNFVLREVASHGPEGKRVIVGVLTDVSSLRQAEMRWLQAKQAAEQANAAKSIFLANMSHEIRTPLSGVIGTLRIALNDNRLHEDGRDLIKSGLSSAESLLSIINDILDFSKIEAGRLVIEQIDFDLYTTARESLQVFKDYASSKSLAFGLEIAPDLPRFFRGDPTRIRQVLINLVSNAIKFTDRGRVAVRISATDVSEEDAKVHFRVEDSGIGIPADALPRLFQKFQQADTSTTRRYGGTGLGLAICRQLVEMMGGEITVTSRVGVGTAFEFHLPLERGSEPISVEAPTLQPHSHSLRILCAEDVHINQFIIKTLLKDMGHQVEIVDNGRAAVEALAQKDFDLVLMDGRMPEMDGAEATQAIRAGGMPGVQVRDPRIMIVALTANAGVEDRKSYLEIGMDSFLTKPVDRFALHAVVSAAIARQTNRGVVLARHDTESA